MAAIIRLILIIILAILSFIIVVQADQQQQVLSTTTVDCAGSDCPKVNLTEINFSQAEELAQREREIRKHRRATPNPPFDPKTCSLSRTIQTEIRSYKETIRNIIHEILVGSFKNQAFNDLATFVDRFGYRMSSSQNLENSLQYLKLTLVAKGFTNVRTEAVRIQSWVRGYESAQLLEPWPYEVATMAMRFSIGTPKEGIVAEIVVLYQKEALENPSKFKDKIVLCYNGCPSVIVGKLGKAGAKAALLGSHGFGIHNFHRHGRIDYNNSYPKIPVAQLTADDTELFDRIYQRGKAKLVLKLVMFEPSEVGNTTSRNVIGEYMGSTKPNEILGVSGHVDSWDVGQGAQDDGFGVFLALKTAELFKSMSLRPKRTIRIMFWTTEEHGEWGSKAYVKRHYSEMRNWQAQFEADSGCYETASLAYHGHPELGCVLQEIYNMILPNLNRTASSSTSQTPDVIHYSNGWSSDSDQFRLDGVPTIGINNPNSIYHNIYHTNADTMLQVNPTQLDICLSMYSAAAYVLADMNYKVMREDEE